MTMRQFAKRISSYAQLVQTTPRCLIRRLRHARFFSELHQDKSSTAQKQVQSRDISTKRGILERLQVGELIIGDGGYTWALEKRGYVKSPGYTPECVVEYPEAVTQLTREFVRAGADVAQAFTFFGEYREIQLEDGSYVKNHEINTKACKIVHNVANEVTDREVLVCGGVNTTFGYKPGCDTEEIRAEFRNQMELYKNKNMDFVIGEYFFNLEESVLCVQEMKKTGLPVALTMCISGKGDYMGYSAQECAVRLAEAGADIIGVNCRYDPPTLLKTVALMKEGLQNAGLLSQVFLMIQPIGFHAPEAEPAKSGYVQLPDWPLAMESRTLTRFDVHKFAREAYELGVRYIGGCCGFEPYHIRAIAEELAPERGWLPHASKKHSLWGEAFKDHHYTTTRKRSGAHYWCNIQVPSGRPTNAALCVIFPDEEIDL